jgi:hypothetical protein
MSECDQEGLPGGEGEYGRECTWLVKSSLINGGVSNNGHFLPLTFLLGKFRQPHLLHLYLTETFGGLDRRK